jgi:hypothetical protein
MDILTEHDLIALDTCLWIYHFENHPIYRKWTKPILQAVNFLVPTRWRGNAVMTRQRRRSYWTLARPEWVPTLASGNQKMEYY